MPPLTAPSGKPPTPAGLGYRMPAEWEPHAATWLSWPRPDGISFPGGGYAKAVPALTKMVGALAESEAVYINVGSVEQEAEVRRHLGRCRAVMPTSNFSRSRPTSRGAATTAAFS